MDSLGTEPVLEPVEGGRSVRCARLSQRLSLFWVEVGKRNSTPTRWTVTKLPYTSALAQASQGLRTGSLISTLLSGPVSSASRQPHQLTPLPLCSTGLRNSGMTKPSSVAEQNPHFTPLFLLCASHIESSNPWHPWKFLSRGGVAPKGSTLRGF